MPKLLALTFALLLLGGAATSCGEPAEPARAGVDDARAGATDARANATEPRPDITVARTRGTVVAAQRSRYGTVLFDGRRRALYLFTRERTTPRCYGACAKAWPPLLTRGRPSAGKGARASLLGTVRRRDGSRQVTYRGHPLYRYVGDRRPGEILCQNVEEFGGLWLVVAPSGRAVR
jgi:predicted lipoprotein with Yx(FWY)xxD motif